MSELLRRPNGTNGKVHDITVSSAKGALSPDWAFVGFGLYRLEPGQKVTELTGDREVILVLIEGKARVTGAGQDWGELGDRMSVFERKPPHCLYLPDDSEWTAIATTDCTLAVCTAPGRGGHSARLIGPEGIVTTPRGKGTNTRYINAIAMEERDVADSLLVTEVFTPDGHWS